MYIVKWREEGPHISPYFIDGEKGLFQWSRKLSNAKLFSSKEEAIYAVNKCEKYWVLDNLIVTQYIHPLNVRYADTE